MQPQFALRSKTVELSTASQRSNTTAGRTGGRPARPMRAPKRRIAGVPRHLVRRWEAKIRTPFVELPPEEQESDREQVRQYLPTVVEILTD
jgi:hypothetical protein